MYSIGVFHSTYYNEDAFKFAFTNFRKYFPYDPYVIYSDNGDDFSEYVDENTYYLRSDVRYWGSGPNSLWYDKWELWESYYKRLKDTCEICNTDYIMIMEDDVLITESFNIDSEFDFCGPCSAKLSNHTIAFLKSRGVNNKNMFYGLCGGAMFNRKKFLDNYDEIIKNLKKFHYEYSDNLRDPIAISPDGNFTIQFNLLGFNYTCSKWLENKKIIHPFKEYYK